MRAPLRHIDSFGKLLSQGYADWLDERGKKYIQFMREGSERMSQLVDDLLELSRVTRAEMRRQPVNLSEVAGEIAKRFQEEQPERKVEFTVTPEVTANGDLQLLRAVPENLLGNAWKFNSKREEARVEFGVFSTEGQEGTRTVYFVRDNGAGFDPAYAERLFAPFQRLHKEDEFSGTGIGLATVQRIVRRHGGRVWAEGEVDTGATFYFTLG
ncbi:MAG: hypothetical protein HYX94_12805 [Chloroflexi bacterium]|nr:hypothetical protein [Chloroflexota bacterium]